MGQTSGGLNDHEKEVKKTFGRFLGTLRCFDHETDMIQETADRVARMYCRELFVGLYTPKPEVTLDTSDYKGIVIQKNIDVKTVCKHHFMPVLATVTIAYRPIIPPIGR